jgi:hypothetical protein
MSQQEKQHSRSTGVEAEVQDFYERYPYPRPEKRLFDAIDGNHSIGGIVERTLPSAQTKSQVDMARTFFEELWWYDQVVFDALHCRARREET